MAAGLCVICGKPPLPDSRYCEPCREKRRRPNRVSARRQRSRQAKAGEGVGLSFKQFTVQTFERTNALSDLAKIARHFPDLFTEVCRSWLAENGEPPPGNGEARGSAGKTEADPDVLRKPGKPAEVADAMAALIAEKGPLPAKELSEEIGCHGNSIHRQVRRDGRFVSERGLIRLKSPDDPPPRLPNGFRDLPVTGYDRLAELIASEGPVTPTEAAERLGHAVGYMEVAASNDTRFVRQNGHLMLSGRPKGALMATPPSLSSPEPSSMVGANA